MSSFYKIFLLLNVMFTVVFIMFGKYLWLLNFQIGSISAIGVALGSFWGYKKEVLQKSKEFQDVVDDKDIIDKIEDPYEIFDNNEIKEVNLSKDDIKEIIAKEKAKIKKFSLKNLFLSKKAIFSPFRLIGYILLVIGFFWLNANHFLHIFSYLFGIFLLPLCAIFASL